MFSSIIEDIKREFQHGNMVTRIIILNVLVFVAINIVYIFLGFGRGEGPSSFYHDVVHFFCMSSDWWYVLTHPWVIITSMFLHEGFFHILFNMLFLYWFGAIVGDFIGNHRILPIYLLGGIAGALVYFFSANMLPYGGDSAHFALGASAAVMAIVVASGTLSPDYEMNLLLLGSVKLKYIVAVLVFLDLIQVSSSGNVGGSFAHLGGALFGFLYIKQLRNGVDWTEPVNRFLDRLAEFWDNLTNRVQGKPRKPKVVYKSADGKKQKPTHRSDYSDFDHQEQLDAILDKIKQTGYESLSQEEKEFLFKASRK